jgi:hypothetical protein
VAAVDISVSDNIAGAVAEMQHGADLLVEALADRALELFQSNVHVITGAMQASGCVITAHGSDYGASVAAAAALNPKADFAPEEQVGPGEAVVQVPVGYAAFEEFGTSARAAHPALVPAVEATAAAAEQIAREVFRLA